MAKRKAKVNARSGNLRIIAGRHRGRRLSFPLTDNVRPTPDRVRETLFNWLAGRVGGASCLDLFCGSGALGIEALSRSAKEVTFVDASANVVNNLQDQLKNLGESANIYQQRAEAWLADQPDGGAFDIIFLDPPFYQNMLTSICQVIAAKRLISTGGHIYIEVEASLKKLPVPPSWQIKKHIISGDVQYALCCSN